MAFNLARFRELAFGRARTSQAPLYDVADAQQLVARLPQDDPVRALADLTNWVQGMNSLGSLPPERRARVLLALDQAARPLWQALGARYLAPRGRPGEGREGDPGILRALFDSASELAHGLAIVLEAEARWSRETFARLAARSLRWLGRRLSLAHMLALPVAGATWEGLHRAYTLAEANGAALIPVPAYEGAPRQTTARREYLRALLLELADPAGMRPREVELAYRVVARVASAARLEPTAGAGTSFAVTPAGDARPAPLGEAGAWPPGTRHIDVDGCLPLVHEALERDPGCAASDPETLYGPGFTIGERRTVLERLLRYWGGTQTAHRAEHVSMALPVRVVAGYDEVIEMVPALEKGKAPAGSGHHELQLKIDDTTRTLSRAALRAAEHARYAAAVVRLVDASAGELGLAAPREAAAWAKPGALLAVQIEPGQEWVVGALRRVFALGEELRLSMQVLSAHPRSVPLRAELERGAATWETELRYDRGAPERLKRGILLDPASPPGAPATMLLPPRLAEPGGTIELLLAAGAKRVRVAHLIDDTESFQRAAFAPA